MPIMPRSKKVLLEQIVEHAKLQLTPDQVPHIETFVQGYFDNIDIADLKGHKLDYLLQIVLRHFNLMYCRNPQDITIEILHFKVDTTIRPIPFTSIMIVHPDMPFLIDSVRIAINRHGYMSHWVIDLGGMVIERDSKGIMRRILDRHAVGNNVYKDAPIYIALNHCLSKQQSDTLQADLKKILKDVHSSVSDWRKMRKCLEVVSNRLEKSLTHTQSVDGQESIAFLKWLPRHFIFLGCRYYQLNKINGDYELCIKARSGLGVLRRSCETVTKRYSQLPFEVRDFVQSPRVLIFSKTKSRSTVHRASYTDFIGVKDFDEKGELIGEYHFIGLYMALAYSEDPTNIPLLRDKIQHIIKRANFSDSSYAGYKLIYILKNLPRNDLLQANVDELFELTMSILRLERQERRKTSLFIRKDPYNRFFSCFVYMPRDYFASHLLHQIDRILKRKLKGIDVEFSTYFPDSPLMRIHYIIHVHPKHVPIYDKEALEKELMQIAYPWKDALSDKLSERFGCELGVTLFSRYKTAFQHGYQEIFTAKQAVDDIGYLEILSSNQPLQSVFYIPKQPQANVSQRLKLFHLTHDVPLSNVLPMLENMGIHVMDECTYWVKRSDSTLVWISDLGLVPQASQLLDNEKKLTLFKEAFHKIYLGKAEDDGFNRLILQTGLSWRAIRVLRAYASYFRQIRFPFSFEYIQSALLANIDITTLLMTYFSSRFSLDQEKTQNIKQLEKRFVKAVEGVKNPDEDRILCYYFSAIKATLRTNYHQHDAEGRNKSYLSFKIAPRQLANIPRPVPWREIFVYGKTFEGTHLRTASVARGGIRWSDRREDFRTEVLGLAKAQHVKNAIIVPAGAKGGFIAKQLPIGDGRAAIQREGLHCYQLFIHGLLDLVDNYVKNKLVKPLRTTCYDEDDTYLVVAADKGTASFSDVANKIAMESYNYWLGNAFASGGCTGYDHKAMGITARGAWESVLHHFHTLGIDSVEKPFTVIGIGDMSGDVFGNGMLLSKQIKLIAAFNHQHIFVDPNPDPKISYKERNRLFKLPVSTWMDYSEDCLSKGGRIFSRKAKLLSLTPQIKQYLKITKSAVTPQQLIRCLLQAEVDLLWNGGIGTYVKARSESHDAVRDRSNDTVRVDGHQLRCRVVAEGGNLGFTQLSRVEYELSGGRINTDFIDNSAGVDCSDHEVNIKILLNDVVDAGQLDVKKRNVLLTQLQNEVACLVLRHNVQQNIAISLATSQTPAYLDLYDRYITEQQQKGHLDRDLACLPSSDTLCERKILKQGLMRPEIATLLTHAKISLKQEIVHSKLPDTPYFAVYMKDAFPARLSQHYPDAMNSHPLRREIIATQLSNNIVNDMGIVFVHQMRDEMNADTEKIVSAYIIANEIFQGNVLIEASNKLLGKIDANTHINMISIINGLIRRGARWLLRNRYHQLDVRQTIEYFKDKVALITESFLSHFIGTGRESYLTRKQALITSDVPTKLAVCIASMPKLHVAFDLIIASEAVGDGVGTVVQIYSPMVEHLELIWLRSCINAYPLDNHWTVLARAALKNDLDRCIQELLILVLRSGKKNSSPGQHLEQWIKDNHSFVYRWKQMLDKFKASSGIDFVMLNVAVRELSEYLRS